MRKIDFKTLGQGNFTRTGPRSGKFQGPKHGSGGIKTVGPDGNLIEVEGGESVGEVNTNAGRQPYIYSQFVKRHGGVSYADEFDRMVKNGASQKQLDMLAAEQDSKAKNTGGSVQVTPMQRGGLSNRVMKYENGGQYGTNYSSTNVWNPENNAFMYPGYWLGQGADAIHDKYGDIPTRVDVNLFGNTIEGFRLNPLERAADPFGVFTKYIPKFTDWVDKGLNRVLPPGSWGGITEEARMSLLPEDVRDAGGWEELAAADRSSEENRRERKHFSTSYTGAEMEDQRRAMAQRGGFTNNINNNNMANRNRLSRRVMKYDSQAQMGGPLASYNPRRGVQHPQFQQQFQQQFQRPQFQQGGSPIQGYITPRQTGLQYQQGGIPQYGWGGDLLEGAGNVVDWMGRGLGKVGRGIGKGLNLAGNIIQAPVRGMMGQYGSWQDFGQDMSNSWLQGPGTTGFYNNMGGGPKPGPGTGPRPNWYSQRGGLANRVMQYQGPGGTGVVPDSTLSDVNKFASQLETVKGDVTDYPGGQGGQGGQGDIVDYMMSLIRTGAGGIESLPPEAQESLRQTLTEMSDEEKTEWINYMTKGVDTDEEGNPIFQKKSPTRSDSTETILQNVLKQSSSVVD